ncbi:MAG: arginine deiminase [Prevotella sp.]|nr:arginine deiminase [Prevotella sp.]MBR5698087.1 arginine deiminase [Prevotella sp.]
MNTTKPCKVSVTSETGHLNAVLLRRPGVEIERMTPLNAAHALYSDILDKPTVDKEYDNFCGVLEKWTKVYYVKDILAELLRDHSVRAYLVNESLRHDGRRRTQGMSPADYALAEQFMELDNDELVRVLIEGYENPSWDGTSQNRYLLHPLYNLLFTRDASSTIYDRVLINSMSFEVRERESLLYDSIFRHFFGVEILNASQWDAEAHTEGGDVLIASDDVLCIGQGIRTNPKGIQYLTDTFAREREHFNIIVQELPMKPESFIHLDMVFTFLGQHHCMAFEPLLKKEGLFADKDTTLITIDGGKISYHRKDNMLEALRHLGWDIEPVLCGGSDPWIQLREQWHSGGNFFALGDDQVMGYRRNTHTVDALDKAGFAVLNAEDIIADRVSMKDYDRFVAVFPGSELPRAGGGARCMTMPIWRENV